MDKIKPTVNDIEILITPDAAAYANALGEDWCHPMQLRRLRDFADKIIPKLTEETDPEGYAANDQLNWIGAMECWVKLVKSWTPFMHKLLNRSVTAYDHLMYLIADNTSHNWRWFEAPKHAIAQARIHAAETEMVQLGLEG